MGATVSQNNSPSPPTASTTTLTTTATTRGEETSGSNGNINKAAAKSSSNINDLDNQKVNNQNVGVSSFVPPALVPQLQSSDKKKIEEEKEKEKEKENVREKEKEKKKEPNNKQAVMSNMGLPHNYHAIIKDADDADEYMNNNNGSSGGGRHRDVHSDVFLNKKTKKYWVDSYGNNCFMLLARNLSITWGEDKRYWHWPSIKESSTSAGGEVFIDVAELSNVCWLEVNGKLNTSNLSPKVIYEVVFMVMLKDPAYGWEVPVNLRLTLPDGTKQEHKENLQSKLREQWVELYVGEFQAPSSSAAAARDIEISLFEYAGGKWKRGLVIKGIIVRTKQTKRV